MSYKHLTIGNSLDGKSIPKASNSTTGLSLGGFKISLVHNLETGQKSQSDKVWIGNFQV